MKRATRMQWDRYQTRCAKVSGDWRHHKLLPGWKRAARDDRAWLAREHLLTALEFVSCAYYTRGAKCSYGCWEEPRCMTDAPVEGWRLWGAA